MITTMIIITIWILVNKGINNNNSSKHKAIILIHIRGIKAAILTEESNKIIYIYKLIILVTIMTNNKINKELVIVIFLGVRIIISPLISNNNNICVHLIVITIHKIH